MTDSLKYIATSVWKGIGVSLKCKQIFWRDKDFLLVYTNFQFTFQHSLMTFSAYQILNNEMINVYVLICKQLVSGVEKTSKKMIIDHKNNQKT